VVTLRATLPDLQPSADLERYLAARHDDPDVRRFNAACAAARAARSHHDTPQSQERHRAQLERALDVSRTSRRNR